ncbi:MAG: cytochrome c3 family protein [Capsulimonadaceae bacterium]
MRTLIGKVILPAIVVALPLFGSAAMAGDYHFGQTLICSDCHTMHYSLSHGYDGTQNFIPPAAGGPFVDLLKAPGYQLCLLCHQGLTTVPDVIGANTVSNIREAGALPTGTTPYENWKGHDLGTQEAPPGNNGTFTLVSSSVGLQCIDCHNQHGATTPGAPSTYTLGQWRNLKNEPGGSTTATPVKYSIGTDDLTTDVFERNATLGQPQVHYDISNVDFNEPNLTDSAIAEWCKGCHTYFHGAVGDPTTIGGSTTTGGFLRHPAATVIIGALGGGNSSITQWNIANKTNWVKVMDPAGQWAYSTATTAANGGYVPTCITCHKAHGNQNAFALINEAQTGTVTEQGTDGQPARTLCKQCHVEGNANGNDD